MMAVALADGEFWQRRPETGIDWRRIVHAEETLTLHRPLPPSADLVLSQRIVDIFDRGAEKGAVMQQTQSLDTRDGKPLATIDVITMLRGDGGFGGKPYQRARVDTPRDRTPDAAVAIRTPPNNDEAMFRLDASLAVSAGLPPGKAMMRGLGCFGLAGRGVLSLACGNDPARLRRLTVRYTGAMLTDETMWLELWHLSPGSAVFRMSSRERSTVVIDNGLVEFAAESNV
jgi:hypothetical protein